MMQQLRFIDSYAINKNVFSCLNEMQWKLRIAIRIILGDWASLQIPTGNFYHPKLHFIGMLLQAGALSPQIYNIWAMIVWR